jgi:hypothetical protein
LFFKSSFLHFFNIFIIDLITIAFYPLTTRVIPPFERSDRPPILFYLSLSGLSIFYVYTCRTIVSFAFCTDLFDFQLHTFSMWNLTGIMSLKSFIQVFGESCVIACWIVFTGQDVDVVKVLHVCREMKENAGLKFSFFTAFLLACGARIKLRPHRCPNVARA